MAATGTYAYNPATSSLMLSAFARIKRCEISNSNLYAVLQNISGGHMPRKTDARTKDLFAYAHDNRESIVYLAVNRVNGKKYVGITRLTLDRRKDKHFTNARCGYPQHFYCAIRKHGEDNFVFSVLSSCQSYKAAGIEERRLISEMRPEYNKTEGGEGVVGHRHNKETRKKMSRAKGSRAPWKTGAMPADIRAKISAKKRGYKYETISAAQMRSSLDAAKLGNDARRAPMYCVTDGIAFKSVHEAARYYEIQPVSVMNYTKGALHRRRADKFGRLGLKFAYVRDVFAEQGAR